LSWAKVKYPVLSAELEQIKKVPYKRKGYWRFKVPDRLRA